VAARSTIGDISAGLNGPVTLSVNGYGSFAFDSPVEARDEAVRLCEIVSNVRDDLEQEGLATCMLSDEAILCGLRAGGFRVRGDRIQPQSS
jgi:hypothetical protein